MAIDASQFDSSELPPAAQRLNPDADGNVNAEGDLGGKKFRVENGIIKIIDQGKELDPTKEEHEEVLNVLSSQVSDKDVTLKAVTIDGKPGIQLDVDGLNVLEYLISETEKKVKAAQKPSEAEKLTDTEAFIAETRESWRTEMEELQGKSSIDLYSIFDLCRSERGTADYLEHFKTIVIDALGNGEHRTQKVLQNLNTVLTGLEGMISFPTHIELKATSRGLKLSDPKLKELEDLQPSFGKEMKDKLTELRDQLAARMAFEKDRAAAIDKANTELAPEVLRHHEDIEAGFSLIIDATLDRIQELHGQIDRSADPAAMAAAQEEINGYILPYLAPELNMATYYRDLYQGLIDKLALSDILERDTIRADLTKKRDQHAAVIAQLSGPVEKAKEILQTVENITGIRSYAQESLETHKKVPPTRFQRIKAAMTGSAAVSAVRQGMDKVSAERKAAEENTKVVIGECKIPWPSGKNIVFDFKEDGIYQILGYADGNTIEGKIGAAADIDQIIAALNEGKARAGKGQKDMFGKPGEHVKFSLDPDTGAVIRVDEGAPGSWKDLHRGILSSVRSAREERRARKTETRETKKAQKELRSFIKDNKYDTWVAENQKNGLAKEQIVELLYSVLQKDHPEKADKVEEIYSEIILMKDVRPFVKEHKLGEKVHDLKDPVTGADASEEIVRAMLEKELPKNIGDEEKEAIIKEAFSAAKWHGSKEKVSEFASKRKRNLKLLIPFTKEKEWLKWMDEKKIVRSIRKQREDGEKDPAFAPVWKPPTRIRKT
jgi:hypothetical protein